MHTRCRSCPDDWAHQPSTRRRMLTALPSGARFPEEQPASEPERIARRANRRPRQRAFRFPQRASSVRRRRRQIARSCGRPLSVKRARPPSACSCGLKCASGRRDQRAASAPSLTVLCPPSLFLPSFVLCKGRRSFDTPSVNA